MKKIGVYICISLFLSCGKTSEEDHSEATIDSLKIEISELKAANDTLSDHLMQRAYLTRSYPEYFDSIQEPEQFILQKLQENPSLIPKEAVLGGTMRFTSVSFIDDELLIAEYEDGHIMGKTVYSYTMDRRGDLQFEMIGTVK